MRKECQRCGEADLLYGGDCFDCCMDLTGGNFAEEMLAAEECGEAMRADA